MIDIYRQALRHYWSALPALVAFSLMVSALDLFASSSGATTGTMVGQLFILYYFHRVCLFNEPVLAFGRPGPEAPPMKFGGFMMISLALIVVPVAIALFLAVSARAGEEIGDEVLVSMALYTAPLYLISLSMFGTALPASVARPGNFQMSKGIKVAFGTMWRLILGPGVVFVVGFGILIAANYLLRDLPAYQSTAGQLVFLTLATLLGFLPSMLGVVVLCHMYHLIMGTDIQNPAPAETFS
jgi:hypothetical protein